MPPILTQVARASDTLPLVATSTPTHNLTVSNELQQEAKQLLRSMTTGYVVIISLLILARLFLYVVLLRVHFDLPIFNSFIYIHTTATQIKWQLVPTTT